MDVQFKTLQENTMNKVDINKLDNLDEMETKSETHILSK